MEKEIHQFWGEVNFGEINFGLSTSILYVNVQDAKNCGQEIREDSETILWGDTADKKKMHLVGWNKMTLNKQMGGLGIKKLQIQNLSLLSKWRWRFGSEKESLWVKTIKAKYGIEETNWLPCRPSNISNFSHIWTDITSLTCEGLEVVGIIFDGFKLMLSLVNQQLFGLMLGLVK